MESKSCIPSRNVKLTNWFWGASGDNELLMISWVNLAQKGEKHIIERMANGRFVVWKPHLSKQKNQKNSKHWFLLLRTVDQCPKWWSLPMWKVVIFPKIHIGLWTSLLTQNILSACFISRNVKTTLLELNWKSIGEVIYKWYFNS